MLNSSRAVEISSNPKLQLLDRLLRECYRRHDNQSVVGAIENLSQDGGLWCRRTFDGFSCWPETAANTTATQPCPDFVVGFDATRLAYKTCTESGRWYLHPETSKPWTNYTTCVDVEDLYFRSLVNSIYIWGYSISVTALLLSLAIFIYFRSLRCTRIRIHMHLFSSVALNNLLWVVWYRAVVARVDVVRQNERVSLSLPVTVVLAASWANEVVWPFKEVWCQILHIITIYFTVTSYIWMFCEGLHLHIALVVVFVRDEAAMRCFVALGWGLPLLIVGAYAGVRSTTRGATERCWMDQSDTFWIIIVPVAVSLCASFVFLIKVVLVLVTKLHPVAPSQHAVVAAKKATRAALILIPLFGLHFVLIPLRPPPEAPGERAYQVISALITSLQGLCVAILFCFTNHEVIIASRMMLARMIRPHEAFPMTGTTGDGAGGDSFMHTRENVV